jgi:O-antigen/teichoic acid export membrane protein
VIASSGPAPGGATGPVLRRVLANAGKLLGGRAVNAGVSLAYTAVAARALGVQTFGILVLIHAFAQLVGDVVKFQSWQTVLQYGAPALAEGRRGDLHRVLRFTLMLDVVSGVVGALTGVAVALAFGAHLGWTAAQAPAAAAYATSVIFMTAAAPLGVLRLLDRFDIMAAQAVLVSLVRLAGAVAGYRLHAGLAFFLLVWAAGTVAGFLLLGFGAWRELRRKRLLEGFRWRGPVTVGVAGAWRFAWATNANATLGVAFTHLVTLMLGALLGAGDAALWRVGRQVADAIAKPVRLLIPALYPELVRLRTEGGQQTMWRLARQIGLGAGAAGVLLLGVSAFAGEPLLRIVMGAGFAAAAGVMTWQVAAAVIDLAALPLEPMVISMGHAGGAVRVRMLVAVAYALILPLLVRRFGMEGAGAGLVAASAAMAAGMFGLLRRSPRSQDYEST